MAISIPTVVSDFVDNTIAKFQRASALPAAPNPQIYLAGQQTPDMIVVSKCIRELAKLLAPAATLTVSGGSANTYTLNDVGAFTADQEVLNLVTIVADPVNPTNDGLTRQIRGNTANALTIYGDFAVALGAGTTYTISALYSVQTMLDAVEANLSDIQGQSAGLIDAFALLQTKLGSALDSTIINRYNRIRTGPSDTSPMYGQPYLLSEDVAWLLQNLKTTVAAGTRPA